MQSRRLDGRAAVDYSSPMLAIGKREHGGGAACAIGLAVLVALGACSRSPDALLVFAAASTSGPLEEIGRDFRAATGREVQFAFGATSDLARQIAAGAPAEVFLAADLASMEKLEGAGLVRAGERVALLSNQLVVIVPRAAPARIAGARDLARVERLALADPAGVPAGVYARSWLEAAGVWDELAPRVVPALDVRAALTAVASGAAPAGIVYRTDAAMSDRVRVALEVPREAGPRIVYPVAPVGARASAWARAFVAFLQAPGARAAFARYGFVVL